MLAARYAIEQKEEDYKKLSKKPPAGWTEEKLAEQLTAIRDTQKSLREWLAIVYDKGKSVLVC